MAGLAFPHLHRRGVELRNLRSSENRSREVYLLIVSDFCPLSKKSVTGRVGMSQAPNSSP